MHYQFVAFGDQNCIDQVNPIYIDLYVEDQDPSHHPVLHVKKLYKAYPATQT